MATKVPAAAQKAAEAQGGGKGHWVAIIEGTGGVTVDRSNGDLYVVVTGKEIFKEPGKGVWKSTDRGATFARVDGNVVGGRCETGYALCHDPNGKRLFCFMLDGPSGYTLDAGATWAKVSDEVPSGHVMVVFKDVCYWVGQNGLLVSKDKGATWEIQGQPVQAAWGPYFGKDEKHIVVVGKAGVQETIECSMPREVFHLRSQ